MTEIRLITPAPANQMYAMIRVIKDCDPDLDSAKVSLGVLGVISQVTLQLQPMFKRSVTFVTRSDEDLAEQAVKFGHQHEFADLAWYPSKRKVVYREDDRVPVNTSGNGVYDIPMFQSRLYRNAVLLYYETDLPLEDRVVHVHSTIPGRVQASPSRNLEMVEVKYWRFDTIVWRVMQYLMFGTREL